MIPPPPTISCLTISSKMYIVPALLSPHCKKCCFVCVGFKLCLRGDNFYISDLSVTKQKKIHQQKNVHAKTKMLISIATIL